MSFLTSVRAADPEATVAIYSSDHFVYPEAQLVEAVRHVVRAINFREERLILLGIRPDGVDLDYGYIQLDRYVREYGPTLVIGGGQNGSPKASVESGRFRRFRPTWRGLHNSR